MRKAGILMPVASLPSKYGIGDFGPSSYEFIDLIKQADFKIWQLLPLNPLGYGNSPYQPYSSKAMDELYISLDVLVEEGLLDECQSYNEKSVQIHYDKVRHFKQKYLKRAFKNFVKDQDYYDFISESWVYDYAVFMTLKKRNNMLCWNDWVKTDKEWITKRKGLSKIAHNIEYEMFIQYTLVKQWKKLRAYANQNGIEVMGDIPIYVGIDSLDVWSYQKGFLLDDDGRPEFIAGVPPDYFSAEGQRWGNPIYNWQQLEKDGFKFWLDRLEYSARLFDSIRIDHFRAFDTYWKIPASCPTAIEGEWVEAPGYALFDKIYKTYPDIQIVAEDLGDLRPQVLVLRDYYNLMGMRIVQHSFDPVNEMMDREHLIAYTGTHDNETIKYWYSNIVEKEKVKYRKFFKDHNYNYGNIVDNIIQYTFDTKANYAIISMVDLLHKNDDCRINFPGTVGEPNWMWRMNSYDQFKAIIDKTAMMIKKSKR